MQTRENQLENLTYKMYVCLFNLVFRLSYNVCLIWDSGIGWDFIIPEELVELVGEPPDPEDS